MKITTGAERDKSRPRLFVYSLGLIFQRRVRHILKAYGWQLKVGLPLRDGDAIAVWGRKKTAQRGIAIAQYFDRPLITVEDAFLRSVLTGRQGALSMGVVTDELGIYFDTENESDLDNLIEKSLQIAPEDMNEARIGIDYMRQLKLSKYNNFTRRKTNIPEEFVLVVDQTLNDAAITKGGANSETFAKMLACARAENPNAQIVIKTHPETTAGKRLGHFSEADCDENTSLLSIQLSPWDLFEKAQKIYCVTSQVGLEAIFAGHKPVVFGKPFYAGLGLSDDRAETRNKAFKCSAEQLFWATHLQYSKWYDPYFDRKTDFQTAARNLHAQSIQHHDNKHPSICLGIRLWKRGFFKRFLSAERSTPRFIKADDEAVKMAQAKNGRVLVWANKVNPDLVNKCEKNKVPLIRVEDGFLRSVGLGAQLVAPVSLAFDDMGIYYDPTSPSRLECLVNNSDLSDQAMARARDIRERVVSLKMTKYNLASNPVNLKFKEGQKIILVPGQVEDDASILKGAGQIKTNLDLLKTTRSDFPDAYIVFKPHPDVEVGLRDGSVSENIALQYADQVLVDGNMAVLLEQIDHVATITSLTGFEALLRGKSVTCYGQPFYASWGLTDDRADKIERRKRHATLDELIHATLIDYPRYWDPITMEPCPVEVILERFEKGQMNKGGLYTVRLLAKLQGIFASYAHLWR